MPDTQDHDLLPFEIEDHSIISNTKPISSKVRLFERFSVSERVLFVPLESFT